MDGCCVWDYSLVTDAEGRREEVHRLEQPFLYCTADGPELFFCAIKPRADRHGSVIAAMSLKP